MNDFIAKLPFAWELSLNSNPVMIVILRHQMVNRVEHQFPEIKSNVFLISLHLRLFFNDAWPVLLVKFESESPVFRESPFVEVFL